MRQGKIVGFLIVVAAALPAPAASAAAEDAIRCSFSAIGTFNPRVPSIATEAQGDPHGLGFVVDSENGNFTFSGDLSCVIRRANGAIDDETEGWIHGQGAYSNIVCATGTFDGKAWIEIHYDDNGELRVFTAILNFSTDFVGGRGAINVRSLVDSEGREATGGGGELEMLPLSNLGGTVPRIGCVNYDVDYHELNGSLVGVW